MSEHLTPIYVYLPNKVLPNNAIRILFEDLIKSCRELDLPFRLLVAASLNDLFLLRISRIFRANHLLIVPHQSLLRRVKFFYPLSSTAVWYTHTDTRQKSINRDISSLRALLLIDQSEYSKRIVFSPITSRTDIVRFALGYDSRIWGNPVSNLQNFPPTDRDIDILVSVNYNKEYFYARRKNYPLLIDAVNLMSKKGLKVHVNGPGWLDCSNLFDSEVDVTSIDYSLTPSLFRRSKLFILFSNYEGGNTALLEALASGCKVLSTPTGFALDFIHLSQNIIQYFHSASQPDFVFSRAKLFLELIPTSAEIEELQSSLVFSEFRTLLSTLGSLRII
jgi:glycosyltransferase involved in cell wall biosynthesis